MNLLSRSGLRPLALAGWVVSGACCLLLGSMELVAAEPSPGQATMEPTNLVLNEAELFGCYELVSLVWTEAVAPYQPPRSFELTSAHFDPSHKLIRFRRSGSQALVGAWMLTSPTELTATWITKLAGFSFVVSRRSTDRRFHGRVETYSDLPADYRKNRGQVVFRQVPCSPR